MSASLRWVLFAAIGLLVAVAVAVLATQLVSQKIGISAEPLSAGESLSPRADRDEAARHRHVAGAGPQTTVIQPTNPPAATPGPAAPSPTSGPKSESRDSGGGHGDD